MKRINMELVKKVVDDFNTHGCTLRETAERCGVSLRTAYLYVTEVMPNDTSREILEKNKKERQSRGGKNRWSKRSL